MIFPQIAAEALSKICIELENNRVCSIARYVLFKYVQRWICTFWGFLVSCYRYFNKLSSSCFLTFLSFKFCRKQQKKNSLWMICRVLITMLKVPWFVVLFIYTHFWFHLQSLTVYWLCCQPVILLPLFPGSVTHKNPQWCKVIHSMHPEGPEDWSIDLNMISHLYTFCGFYYGCGLTMHILAPAVL